MALTLTFDLEDNRTHPDQPPLFVETTRQVLEFLRQRGVVGTFFVVGTLADAWPDLVREVAADGHEIGLHGYEHTPLYQLTPAAFADHVARGMSVLEHLSERPVLGFRAPFLSLVPATSWAVGILERAGLRYSSSVLPAWNPINGYPDAPEHAFRWPGGLVELPAPVRKVGPLGLPILGGIYMRYLPLRLLRRHVRRRQTRAGEWIYAHPHDFADGSPFRVYPDTNVVTSALLWRRRNKTYARLDALLEGGAERPLGALVESGAFDQAPVFAQ